VSDYIVLNSEYIPCWLINVALLQAWLELKARGMKNLLSKTLVTVLEPDLSPFAVFSFSERTNEITHNRIPLTIWDRITMVTKIRNLWWASVSCLYF
jgi:hypothetical protein